MATKKTTKPAAKKSTAKKTTAAKTTTVKRAPKKEEHTIYNTNVSIILAMAIEALILLLGYLIIMSYV